MRPHAGGRETAKPLNLACTSGVSGTPPALVRRMIMLFQRRIMKRPIMKRPLHDPPLKQQAMPNIQLAHPHG
jgi:hypothetical protein